MVVTCSPRPHAEGWTLGLQLVLRDHPQRDCLTPSRWAHTSSTCGVEVPLRFPLIENQHLGRPLSPTNSITGAHRDQGSTVGGYLTAWQETSRLRRRSHRRSSRLVATPP